MRVYRVAHATAQMPDGFPAGPYSVYLPDAVYEATTPMCSAHRDAFHPAPFRDPSLRDIAYRESCGFDSEAAMMRWFEPEWRTLLHEADFRLYEYEVPIEAVRVGLFGQTLFTRAQAVLSAAREIPHAE